MFPTLNGRLASAWGPLGSRMQLWRGLTQTKGICPVACGPVAGRLLQTWLLGIRQLHLEKLRDFQCTLGVWCLGPPQKSWFHAVWSLGCGHFRRWLICQSENHRTTPKGFCLSVPPPSGVALLWGALRNTVHFPDQHPQGVQVGNLFIYF